MKRKRVLRRTSEAIAAGIVANLLTKFIERSGKRVFMFVAFVLLQTHHAELVTWRSGAEAIYAAIHSEMFNAAAPLASDLPPQGPP